MIKCYFFLLINLFSFSSYGFVIAKTQTGYNLKWRLSNNNLNIYIDPKFSMDNAFNLEQDQIETIIENSINQWSDNTEIELNPIFTENIPSIGTSSTIRFTNNTALFGEGVLAVTSITHDPNNGNIWSADILINESINNYTFFTGDPSMSSGSSFAFLGDVVTHEMGHLLGLAHSEVAGSSMIFSIFKGQFDIENDDINGVNYLYAKTNKTRMFRGKVTGGEGVGIFGANVQAIMQSTGKVFTAQITDSDGYFYLKDLPDNDYFVLLVTPPKSLKNLPSFFASAHTKVCNGQNYKASFYSQCGGRSQSRPQLFSTSYDYEKLYIDINAYNNLTLKFDKNDIIFDANYYNTSQNADYFYQYYEVYNLGEITIRCKSQLDPGYLLNKYNENLQAFELYNFDRNLFEEFEIAGDTFIGSFNQSEIDQGILGRGDIYHLDYRDFENPQDHFLDLKISTESIASMLKLKVTIKNLATNVSHIYETSIDALTGKNELDFHIKHPLSNNIEENDFEVTILPYDSSDFTLGDQQEILAMPDILKNAENEYLLMFSIGYENGSYQVYPAKQFRFPEDNRSCRQANVSVTSRPNITKGSIAASQGENGGVSCATINSDDNHSGGPPFSFLIGLSLIFLMVYIKESTLKVLSK